MPDNSAVNDRLIIYYSKDYHLFNTTITSSAVLHHCSRAKIYASRKARP